MHSLISRLRSWWNGKLIERNDDPDGMIVFMPYYDRPKARLCLEAVAGFYRRHWQWLWGIAVGILVKVFV